MKKILLIATLGFVTCISKANDGGGFIILAEKDKQSSLFFKMSRNSNRISIFEQLQSLIKIKSNKTNSTQSFYSTYENVLEVLGEPNVKLKNNSIIYTLNPVNGCKAVIEFDANKTVIYIGVKDCN